MNAGLPLLPPLASDDAELRDLAHGEPALPFADGHPTGLHLVRVLGFGAISTVFLAERRGAPSPVLPASLPERLALKLMRPAAMERARRANLDPLETFQRERAALERLGQRPDGAPLVVRFFGEGKTCLRALGQDVEVPWLALELVDGGEHGTTLSERVARSGGTLALPRARALFAWLAEAVAGLHDEGIIHRDLKPDNVLVAGPPGAETLKLADCGMARVDGLLVTIGGVTPAYGGPEQLLSFSGERNPLVGPWTDVHALAALAFFLLAGEHWCRGHQDRPWHAGERRGLDTAASLAEPLRARPELVARLDAVLQRGAAHGLPASAWQSAEAARYARLARSMRPSLTRGAPRYEAVRGFAAALLPLFDEAGGG